MNRLLIVVLNWRTAEMTTRAVQAALREAEGLPFELVIVDNNSGDGSFDALGATFGTDPRIRVLQSGRNGGFGAGNNVGICAGLSDGTKPVYVYILNSDAFPDKGSIKRLYDHLEANQKTGFAGSYIHGPEGDPHITAFRFPSILSEMEGAARFGPISRMLKNHAVPLPLPETTQRVDWLAGASLMMRQKVLDRIGLFDETFFLYFEETDLCLRANRAGWPTDYVRESEVTHIGSVSTGMKTWERMPDYWYASRLHYFTVNHGRFYAMAATLAHLKGGLLWRLRRVIQRKPAADPPQFLRTLALHHVMNITRGQTTRPNGQIAKPDSA